MIGRTLERFKNLNDGGEAGREAALAIAKNYLAKHRDDLGDLSGEEEQIVADMKTLIEEEVDA